ncbi:hypothetical protein D3C71_1474980 [compost metagenome]
MAHLRQIPSRERSKRWSYPSRLRLCGRLRLQPPISILLPILIEWCVRLFILLTMKGSLFTACHGRSTRNIERRWGALLIRRNSHWMTLGAFISLIQVAMATLRRFLIRRFLAERFHHLILRIELCL